MGRTGLRIFPQVKRDKCLAGAWELAVPWCGATAAGAAGCVSSLMAGLCTAGCPRRTQWLRLLWALLTLTPKSLPHQQLMPEACLLLHLGGTECGFPSQPTAASCPGTDSWLRSTKKRLKAVTLIWPDQRTEAGPRPEVQPLCQDSSKATDI